MSVPVPERMRLCYHARGIVVAAVSSLISVSLHLDAIPGLCPDLERQWLYHNARGMGVDSTLSRMSVRFSRRNAGIVPSSHSGQ